MAAAVYCTEADLDARLSAAGVALRTSANPAAGDTAIDQASARIDEYCLLRYGAQLANSRWVAVACADLAVVYFCQQCGNPPPEAFLGEFDRLLGPPGQPEQGQLEWIRLGRKQIPDIPAASSTVPQLTNVHVRERPGGPHVVTEPARSTHGSTRPPRPVRRDHTDPLRWTPDW